jgi:hypothetical protein
MEKQEFRFITKHEYLHGKTLKETEEYLTKYYGKFSPSPKIIHKLFADFARRQVDTNPDITEPPAETAS